jgi:hypothetical protein
MAKAKRRATKKVRSSRAAQVKGGALKTGYNVAN